MTGTEAVMKTDKKTLALIVDDGPGIAELLTERLARAGIETSSAGTAEEAEEAFGKLCPDIILVDYSLPGRSGLQLISDLRKKAEATGCEELPPFIVITGHGDERLAVEMMKLGAADYLVKDSEFLAKVAPAVTRALREHRIRLQLRESENRYRDLVENLNDAVFTLSPDGRFTYMSAAIRAMSGHYPEEVVGTAFADWIHPDDLPAVNRDFTGALDGTLKASEFRFRKKDGSYGWGRTSSRLIMEGGRIAGLRGLFSDITERKRMEEILRESEEKFRSLFEQAPLGYQSLDGEGRFLAVNDAWLSVLGYAREEIIGRWFGDFLAPAYVEAFRERFPVFKAQGHIHSEFEMRRKDGTLRFVAFEGRIAHSVDGAFKQTHCILQDITESRKAALKLAESEARFRTLFECGNDAIFVHPLGGNGVPGKFTEVNGVACARLGYTREELLNMGPADVDASGMDDKRRAALERLASAGHAIFSMTHKKKDGSGIPVEISASRFESAGGSYVVSICRDITERVKAEDDLRRGEERYRSLLESLPDIVMNFDREYRHTFVSSNVAEIGIEPEVFLGKKHAELGFAPELCRFFEEKLRSVFDSGNPLETEFEADLPAGRRMFSWRLTPQLAADGSVASVTSLARDITEYRSLAADYRQLFETMLDGFALHEMIYDDRGRPADYRFLRLNPAFERLTGLKAAETEGRTALEILKDGAREWVEIYGEVAATGEAARFEKYSEPLGRYYDILAFRPRPGQFATIFKDVTAQKAAEVKLRENAAMLEVAGRMSRFGGWSVDLAAGVCHWSDEVAAIHEEPAGFSPPVEKGIAYYAPEYRDRITEVFEACAREGAPYDEEMEIITARGNRRWIRTIGEAERDAAGKIVRVSGSFQDISDRKRMELALRDSEETFRQLVEHSPDGIFIQLEGELDYLNPEALRMFGAGSESELKGTPIFDRFHPDFHDIIRERVGLLMKEKRRVPEIEEVCLRLDGSSFPVMVSAVPYEREGRAGAIVTIRDFTERKRMQEDLLKSQKIESLGTLAGGIAHDFNNIRLMALNCGQPSRAETVPSMACMPG
jgi:PAS domain S-box-containing protein